MSEELFDPIVLQRRLEGELGSKRKKVPHRTEKLSHQIAAVAEANIYAMGMLYNDETHEKFDDLIHRAGFIKGLDEETVQKDPQEAFNNMIVQIAGAWHKWIFHE